MPDPFTTLPLPLPDLILSHLDSLSTLHNVLLASPTASYIFEENYARITMSIISNMPPYLKPYPRYIRHIRSHPSSIRTKCASPKAFNKWLVRNLFSRQRGGKRRICKATTTLAVVRSLVRTAYQVQELSKVFFQAHPEKVGGESKWVDALWAIVLWMDVKDIFRPREKGEAFGGKGIWEQLKWSPDKVWVLAKDVPKDRGTLAATLHNSKGLVFSKLPVMMGFLEEMEIKAYGRNPYPQERLQKLPEIILPAVFKTS